MSDFLEYVLSFLLALFVFFIGFINGYFWLIYASKNRIEKLKDDAIKEYKVECKKIFEEMWCDYEQQTISGKS